MKSRRLFLLPLLAVLALAVPIGAAPSSASAAGPTIEFSPSEVTVEYGDYWNLQAMGSGTSFGGDLYPTIIDAPAGFAVDASLQQLPNTIDTVVTVYPRYDQPQLDPGEYLVNIRIVSFYFGGYDVSSTTPARLSVVPAPLTATLSAVPDPGNRDAVVVSLGFAGDFLSRWHPSAGPTGPQAPEGTWHLTATASDGTTVLDESDIPTSPASMSVAYYWQGATAGEDYTLAAEFVPAAESAERFEITSAADVRLTALPQQRPVPQPTVAGPTAAPAPVAGEGPYVPVWLLVLILVAALGLVIAVATVAVRIGRRPRPDAADPGERAA